jgi:hypothetical protein
MTTSQDPHGSSPRATLLTIAVMLAAVAWLNLGGLSGSERIASYQDNLDGAHPVRLEAARQWKAGNVPLWNPYKRIGAPLLADPVAGALYVGNFPYLFSDDQPRYAQLEQVAFVHALLAALFMFAFLRTIGLGPQASGFGGFVYASNGLVVWLAGSYIQMQNSLVWIPLILACVHRAATGERFWLWTVAGGAVVSLQFFSGYPEYSLYSGLIAGGYALSLALAGQTRGLRPLFGLATIYSVGLALAAVQLLPAVELLSVSRRAGVLSLDAFQSLSLGPEMLFGWLVPGLAGSQAFPPAGACYIGVVAVAFAVEGARGKGPLRLFLLTLLVVGTLLALGPATPISALAHKLPGLNAFRHAFKHLLEVVLALSIFGAIGVERFMTAQKGSTATIGRVALIALAPLVYFAAARFSASPSSLHASWEDPVTGIAIAAAATFIFGISVLAGMRRVALVVACVGLCLTYAANRTAVLSLDWADVDRKGERLPAVELTGDDERFLNVRSVWQPRLPQYLLGDLATEFRVHAVHGAGPFLWQPLADATSLIEEEILQRPAVLSGRDSMLDILSCRLSTMTADGEVRHGQYLVEPYYHEILRTKEYVLVERPGAHPMVRFVDYVICADQHAVEELRHRGPYDLGETALVACTGEDRPERQAAPSSEISFETIQARAGSLVLETRVPEGPDGFLVVSQADMPGWRAFIDGKEVRIYRTYGLVQGIRVPSGVRRIELEYRPAMAVVGALVSATTLALMLCVIAMERRRKRFSPPAG